MKVFVILAMVSYASASSMSAQATTGEELYLDAKCQKCHNQGSNFDAKEKKAKNDFELKGWVSSCDGFFDVGWFPEEQIDVQQYLNEVYYHYDKKK